MPLAVSFQASPGGSYGRVTPARWVKGGAPRGGVPLVVKMLVGENPEADAGFTRRDDFNFESEVLLTVRMAIDSFRDNARSTSASQIGLQRLCYTYGTGTVEDARTVLPRLPKDGDIPERPTPPGTPLFLIAMEPLRGTLWNRQRGPSPFSQAEVLRVSVDLMAGLAALHSLGFAHGDLKWVVCLCVIPLVSCKRRFKAGPRRHTSVCMQKGTPLLFE